jgi:hypothetical protein
MLTEYEKSFLRDLFNHKFHVARYMDIAVSAVNDLLRQDDTLFHLCNVARDIAHGNRQVNWQSWDGLELSILRHTVDFLEYCEIVPSLQTRACVHDDSKLSDLEYDRYVTAFAESSWSHLGDAWRHHTKHNDHHPEHFEGGVWSMHAVQLIEMLCDWLACGKRKGSLGARNYLKEHAERLKIDQRVQHLVLNTLDVLDGPSTCAQRVYMSQEPLSQLKMALSRSYM